MTMSMRGRATSSTRSTNNRNGFNSMAAGGWSRTSSSKTGSARKVAGSTGNASQYRNVGNTFARKIDSFKMLYNQIQGPAKFGRPTPTTLNTFANLINKGAVVQTCTPAQVARWARSTNKNFNSRTPTTSACKTVLGAKFGRGTIKAVARTKNGQFMVATTPTCNGRPFCFPS